MSAPTGNLGVIPGENASWEKSHKREALFAFGANEKYIRSQVWRKGSGGRCGFELLRCLIKFPNHGSGTSVMIAAIIWDRYCGVWDHLEAGQGEARWETRKQGEGVCMAHQCSLHGVSVYLPKSQPDKAFPSSGACFPPPSSFPSVYSYGMLAVCQGLYEVWGVHRNVPVSDLQLRDHL